MYSEQLCQGLAVMDYMPPLNAASNANAVYSGVPIDMSKFKRCLYVINVGVPAAAATIDAYLQSCLNSNFNSSVHNITNSNITQVTAANNTNTQVKLEVRADQVTQQNAGDRYVRLAVVLGGNTAFYSALGFGGESEQKPGSQYEPSSVLQNLVVNT